MKVRSKGDRRRRSEYALDRLLGGAEAYEEQDHAERPPRLLTATPDGSQSEAALLCVTAGGVRLGWLRL